MLLKDLIARKTILFNLLKNIPDKLLNHNVNGISRDSKNIKKDYIFVAIKGEKVDGLDFILEAKQNGAFLVIANKSMIMMR